MPKTNVMLAMTKMFFKIKKIVNQVLANNEGGADTLKIHLSFNGYDPTYNIAVKYKKMQIEIGKEVNNYANRLSD